jgi:hypothetical protein
MIVLPMISPSSLAILHHNDRLDGRGVSSIAVRSENRSAGDTEAIEPQGFDYPLRCDDRYKPTKRLQILLVETVGIEPTSAIARGTASTSVAGALYLTPRSPTPAGLRGASLERCPPIG